MVTQGRAVFVPYGAWELKATYQRNMLLAMLTTVTMVVLAVTVPKVVSWLIGTRDTTIIIDGDRHQDSILIDVVIQPPPIIVPDHPVRPTTPSQNVALTANIRAVPESLATNENNILLPTRQDLNNLNGPGVEERVPSGSDNLGDIVDTGDAFPDPDVFVPVEKIPEMLSFHQPDYPRIAEQLGLTGTVWVKVLVDTEGKVRNALVLRSSDVDALDNAALEGAYKNTFTPGIQNGRAVACWVSYRVEFKTGK